MYHYVLIANIGKAWAFVHAVCMGVGSPCSWPLGGARGGGVRAVNNHPPAIAGIAWPQIKKVSAISCRIACSLTNEHAYIHALGAGIPCNEKHGVLAGHHSRSILHTCTCVYMAWSSCTFLCACRVCTQCVP